MTGLILRNGVVIDPVNGIRGEKMDLFIKEGKIVESLKERKAKTIDVSNKMIMPGGIDIHAHIADGKVNVGRAFRPEDHQSYVMEKTDITRSGSGFSTPSTFMTGYLYAKMGYTTAFTPAVPPLTAKHTHAELNDTPIIDKGTYTLCDGNWFVMKFIKNGDIEKCASYISWLMKATRSFAIKVVNPGGTEAWGWGDDVRSMDDEVPNFEITPKELIEGLIEVNEYLDLPHSVHLHTINLGRPGNYINAIETIKIPKTINKNRQTLHMTHLQYYCYGGGDWNSLYSKAQNVADAVNKSKNVVVDTGSITLDPTTTMTADGPMEYYLQSLTHLKWANCNVEGETSMGMTPFDYSPKMYAPTIQWAIGLELPLLIKDPQKVMITTDHPNGGPFFHYPRLVAWLMSRKFREETLKGAHIGAEKKTDISAIEREYTFDEIAISTRAAPAKALGLEQYKGNLSVGSQGDVSIFDLDPRNIDGNDYKEIEEKLSRAFYTIKDGNIVVKDGKIVDTHNGSTFWVNPPQDKEVENSLLSELDYFFKKNYSVSLASYPVSPNEINNPVCIQPNGNGINLE